MKNDEIIYQDGDDYVETGVVQYSASGLDCISTMGNITSTICSGITTWKQIGMKMHEMDVQFEMFSKQMDVTLEMYKERVPVVSKQLEQVNQMMSKILDKVIAMDTETEQELDYKMRLMDSVDRYVDKVTTMMVKLL